MNNANLNSTNGADETSKRPRVVIVGGGFGGLAAGKALGRAPVQADAENLMRSRRQRRLLLIDLSVPRNIDPAVRRLDNVSLYNIDDLETIAQQGVEARQQELAACYQIIEAHVAAVTEKLDAENERHHQSWLPQEFSTASPLLLQAT
jgi:glutamyl-tRNA reductase